MAGLPMEGMRRFAAMLANLDRFAHTGGFGGSAGSFEAKTTGRGACAGGAAFNRRVKLLWPGAGTEEGPARGSATMPG